MYTIQKITLPDSVIYRCEGMNITALDEADGKAVRYFKRKIADKLASELEFEITTVVLGND